MQTTFQITFLTSLQQIDAAAWNALCADDYPFTRYEFLAALEQSGSVNAEAGWQPQHLIVKDGDEIVAAMPLYLKFHSYGEYVFDWSWADAYQRYGLHYYPKLINAIPFTPCTGARLLLKDETQQEKLVPHIVTAIKQRAQELNASSWHCLFPTPELSGLLVGEKISQRMGSQFHWFNRGYNSWDDFVGTMTSRKRKNINKERRAVAEQGITFVAKEKEEITVEDWKVFYQFYCNTYLKRSGHLGYLTEAFFNLLRENFSDYSLMIIAKHNEKPIAASLYFKDSKTIYGRYWGCIAEYDFLHFETCYYQGIDYAIKHGLQRFDGGAQGEHKIQRGFEPTKTFSNHWLVRDDFQHAIDNFLETEKKSIDAYIEDAKTYLPFKELENE